MLHDPEMPPKAEMDELVLKILDFDVPMTAAGYIASAVILVATNSAPKDAAAEMFDLWIDAIHDAFNNALRLRDE